MTIWNKPGGIDIEISGTLKTSVYFQPRTEQAMTWFSDFFAVENEKFSNKPKLFTKAVTKRMTDSFVEVLKNADEKGLIVQWV